MALLPMSNFMRDARLFDKCGRSSPISSAYDLDKNERYVELAWLKHDYRSAKLPEFGLSANSRFCFLNNGLPSKRVPAAAGTAILLAIEADYLRNLVQTSPLDLNETVWLWRTEDPVKSDVYIKLQVFRSSVPRPVVNIDLGESIKLMGEIPADGYMQVGTILLQPPEFGGIEHRGRADFIGSVQLIATDGEALPVSVRRYRLEDDEKDRGWLTAGINFVETLELLVQEGRLRTNRFDLGVPYENLRRMARGMAAYSPGLSLMLEATVRTYLKPDNDEPWLLKEQTRTIEVEGTPSDSISFSGLCGMAPRRLIVAPDGSPASAFGFPAVRARLERRKPVVAEAVELHIAAHGDSLSVAISAMLIGGPRELSHEFPPCLIGADGETFKIPAAILLEQARKAKFAMDGLSLRINVAVDSSPPSTPAHFAFDGRFLFESDPPEWLACIDFGTSSTALWIGRGTQADGHHVGLGAWLSRIDRYHSESSGTGAIGKDGEAAANKTSFLLPSHIGLSSDINLRADFDPLSLGNLTLAYSGKSAAILRLESLNRTYDVSVPFPSRVQMPDYLDTIITEPKRRMILRAEHVHVDGGVIERGKTKPVQMVDLAKVIEDYFDEFGGYTALSALSNDGATSDKAIIRDIEQAQLDPNARFGLVVTHPCGIDDARRELYRRAGKRFLAAFCGPDPSKQGDVSLVPEALAAARYGIEENYQPVRRSGLPASAKDVFVTLDVGAGTYDVTAIETDSANANHWRLASHFGLAVGGYDLDAALIKRTMSVLSYAKGQRSVSEAFDIRIDADQPDSRHAQWVEMEFQAAKAQLTAQLLDSQTDSYIWRDLADGGPALDILVGKPGGSPSGIPSDGLVVARGTAEIEKQIPGMDARLSYERTASGLVVRLRLGPGVFAPGATPDNLDVLMEVMGSELPGTALAEAGALGRPAVVVVTGRAALWPPLHQRIEQTVAAHPAPGARMSRRQPFKPELMKQAVVLGAIILAREMPGRNLEALLENPIALVSFKIDLQASGASGAGRLPHKVTLLFDDSHVADKPVSKSVVIDGPFVIARIMPGLDREEGQAKRLKLFQDLYRITRIKPFVELTHELAHPLPGRRDGPVEWNVSWHRDVRGLRLAFDCDVPPSIEFGPFGGGRLYVPE